MALGSVGVDAGRGEGGAGRGEGGVGSARNRARGVSFAGVVAARVVVDSISEVHAGGLVVGDFNGISKQKHRKRQSVSYPSTHPGDDSRPDRHLESQEQAKVGWKRL